MKVQNAPTNYWENFGNFITEFAAYQAQYGKDKGGNSSHSCSFCAGSYRVQFSHKGNKYYCSKCRHQIDRYGLVFETTPKFILKENWVEVITLGGKRRQSTFLISYQSLPFIFQIRHKLHFGIKGRYKKNLHRLIYENFYGEIQQCYVIDHVNGNVEDNRLSNLRVANKVQNGYNSKVRKNNTSHVMGVSFRKDKNRWRAYINLRGKQINLGVYRDFYDAVRARLEGEKKYCKEFAPQRHLFEQFGVLDDLPECDFVEGSNGFFTSFDKEVVEVGEKR